MIVESHITYNQELQLNDEVDINCIYFNHDKKRLQYKMEMIHKEKKYLASSIEILALYVDLKERKVAGFEDEKIKLMDDFIKKNKLNCLHKIRQHLLYLLQYQLKHNQVLILLHLNC